MPNLDHQIRLGTLLEREYLAKGRPWYDRLVINANLAQANQDALSLFVITARKPYAIDPITYAFARTPRLLTSQSGGLRSTFRALAEQYELPGRERLGQEALGPSDLGSNLRNIFVGRVLEYQARVFTEALSRNVDFLPSGEATGQRPTPAYLIAPYFIDDFRGPWRDVNLDLVGASRHYASDLPMEGVLAYDSRAASSRKLELAARDYANAPADGLTVWPTDMDEHSSSAETLQSYADLTSALARAGKRVTTAYGGYFAMLLGYRGMSAVTHSVGYGDKRDAEPVVGGGLPPARYYLPPLRDFIPLGDLVLVVQGMSEADFLQKVCSCTICRTLVTRKGLTGFLLAMTETERRPRPTRGYSEVPTARVYSMVRYHFMEARALEFDELRNEEDWARTAERVRSGAGLAAEWLGDYSIGHIERWLSAAAPRDDASAGEVGAEVNSAQ